MLDFIKEYLPIAESLFVILGVAFVVVQIRQQAKIANADHDRQRKQATIDYYNSLLSSSYQFLDDIGGRKLDLSSVNSDKKLRKSVIRYLSRLERLSVGIATDVYDFEILYLMSGRLLIKKYRQFEDYINEVRIDKDAPMLYKEFELLAEKLEKYKEKYPKLTADEITKVAQPTSFRRRTRR